MPEPTSGDPFADLFAPRAADGAPEGASPVTAPGGSAVADTGAQPLSRRAAREAAARSGTTGPTPTAAPATPSAPVTPEPARDVTPDAVGDGSDPAPESTGFQPVPMRTPRPARPEADTAPADDDAPWIFAAAAAAPALPYSRTGANPVVAPATSTPTMVMPATASTPDWLDEQVDSGHRSGRSEGGSTPETRATTGDTRRGGASLDDLFSGSSTTDDIGHPPPPKNKRRRRIGGWIALGIVLLVLGGAAAGTWYVWNTYEDKIREVMGWEEPKDFEAGMANGEAFVTIESGDTGGPISQSLYDAGVTMTPDAFYDFLIDEGRNPMFQPGVFKLQKQMTSEAALAALLDPANKQEFTAQIPEGFTVDGTLQRLSEGTGIPLEEFQAAVADPAAYGVSVDPAIVAAGGNPLEGWLFPATYTFQPGVTAQSAIQTLVDRTIQSLDAAGVPVEDRQRVLTTASIIQREARYEADMQKVATVIENRLDPSNQETFGLLQMDSTAQFGFGEMHAGSASTSEEAQYDPNPWNTYVHPGLPIGPISNPGDVAINAAMNPADGPWLYFVTVNLDTGETVFTSNLADHNRAVAQWQSWCSEHPDSGC